MTKFANTTKTMMTLVAFAAGLTAMSPMMADARPMPQQHMPMKPVAVSFQHDRLDAGASARIDARIAGLRNDIRAGERTRKIDLRQGARLSAKLDTIAATKQGDARHGLTVREAASLNASLDGLAGQVRMATRR